MKNEPNKIEKIVIVGGGTSGWFSAAYLLKATNFNVKIELIEAPNIARVGVGEATIPSIKEELFDFLEIPEEEWMPKCKATYKMGIRFANWKKSAREGGDHYYHSFGEMPVVDGIPLSQIWYDMQKKGFEKPIDYSCFNHPSLCDNYKSPKYYDGSSAVHAAYHFDALMVADFLKEWSIEKGISYVQDELVDANLDESGNILSVIGSEGNEYEADLFIDCSGFRGFLIGGILKEPKISFAKSLINDRALAINLPDESENIRPYTTATAMSSGWMWEIPLIGRSGNGYVYSSEFQTQESAEQELREYFGDKADNIDVRPIKFDSGRRRRSWVKNCVSIGLASSFLEPLESTGLYFVYAALYQLKEFFPGKEIDPALRNAFNDKVSYMVDDVRDFIIIHFCTSPREDTPYWKTSKYDLEIPDSLRQILDLQLAGAPIKKTYHANESLYANFEAAFDRFWTNSNYQSIFGGVNYFPKSSLPILSHNKGIFVKAATTIDEVESKSQKLVSELPSHYSYLMSMAKMKEEEEPVV